MTGAVAGAGAPNAKAPPAQENAHRKPPAEGPGKGKAAPRPPTVKMLGQRESMWKLLKRSRENVLAVIPERSLHQGMISSKLLRRFHIITDPEANKHVLKTNIDNYPKSPETKGVLAKALKKGLFVTDGAEWRWQRRASAPVFRPSKIAELGPVMTGAATESSDRLDKLADTGKPVNISDETMHAAFDVIVRVTFAGGEGISSVPLDVIDKAIDHYLAETGRVSLFDFIGLPNWVPRPGRMLTHPTLRQLKKGADAAIAERRANPVTENPALIDMLISAEDPETGRKMSDEELRDNLITLLIAGHETTALSMSWSLYLAALDPDVQAKARAEARAVLGDRIATAEDVKQLKYVTQVFYEAMRLYPPIPVHMRTAEDSDNVCGHAVRPGDTMILPFNATHRSRVLWDYPDRFIPERFDDMSEIDRYAYIPFSAGPRICIGADFAIQELIILLGTLFARYNFKLVKGKERPKPKLILTLRAEGDIWLEVEKLPPVGNDGAGSVAPGS